MAEANKKNKLLKSLLQSGKEFPKAITSPIGNIKSIIDSKKELDYIDRLKKQYDIDKGHNEAQQYLYNHSRQTPWVKKREDRNKELRKIQELRNKNIRQV